MTRWLPTGLAGLFGRPQPADAVAPRAVLAGAARPGRGDPRARTAPDVARVSPGDVFTPSQPKPGRRQLTGRAAELDRIMQALCEDRSHVVLYSERGRGKTSLANNVVELLRRRGVIVARHTCEAESSFESIMRGLARDLPQALLTTPIDPAPRQGCEAAFPPGPIGTRDVTELMSRLGCRSVVCVVDEFDRIADVATLTRVADTIKQLSDQGVPLLLMIVGVSENLEQILGRHPSIQRNLVAVQLPLLSDADIGSIIEKGGRQSGLSFPVGVVARVTALARGNPYMAQLLGLRLAQAVTARGETVVNEQDFDVAVARIVNEASPQDAMLYAGLTANGRDREMTSALRSLAAGELNVWGCVETIPEADGRVRVGSRHIPAEVWERIEAADVLRAVAPGSGLYVFQNRSLMHHILMLAARSLARPSHTQPASDTVQDLSRVHVLASRA